MFCRYLLEWEKHGIKFSKASRSGVLNHVRIWRGFFKKAGIGLYWKGGKGHPKGRGLSALGNGVA